MPFKDELDYIYGVIKQGLNKAGYICNPNVFYELGISHSFKEAQNIIILKQQGSKVPFDITHLTYIEYDPNNVNILHLLF